jgi:hypothetical protein
MTAPTNPDAETTPLRAVVGSDACSGLACTTHRLQVENSQRKAIQRTTVQNLLVMHDIIHAFAIEDPEGYDNYETSDNVSRFVSALEELLFPNDQEDRTRAGDTRP